MERDKVLKGYQLKYLGSIRRLGMTEHLWNITFTGEKNEKLGSVTLSHGKIVGFNLN